MSLRYATLAAVSTDEQIDKASIPSQLKLTREAGAKMGYTFAGEYIIDGYSRTAYWEWSRALADIPPLRECMNAIHTYDVLIVKNYDRLGSLGMMIYYYFCQYNKQLYSVQQPTLIYPPESYQPGTDISVPSMITSAQQNQIYRIAKINDAWQTGIKKRVEDGKYAKRPPYGYVKVDGAAQLVPGIAALLTKFPGWFLSGLSTLRIAALATETGVRPRFGGKWHQGPVIYILKNPFYAGKVYLARGHLDKTTERYIANKNVELFDGSHEPIWSYDTHLKILDEFERRHTRHRTRHDYNFTSLLKCSVCGKSLLISYDKYRDVRKYWRCPQSHVHLSAKKADQQVTQQLIQLFSTDEPVPVRDQHDTRDYLDRELAATRRRLKRLDEENDAGAYTVSEFAEKRKTLLAREAELQDEERQKQLAARQNVERVEMYQTFKDIVRDPDFPKWITARDPAIVRFQLSRVVRMTVTPQKIITVELL